MKVTFIVNFCHSMALAMAPFDRPCTISYSYFHACLSFVSFYQMAPPLTEVTYSQLQLTTLVSTRRDERLSWPGWLTYNGRFTHINGRQLQVERRTESSPAKDGRSSTAVPCNQPSLLRSTKQCLCKVL